jgi:hypothetical protein
MEISSAVRVIEVKSPRVAHASIAAVFEGGQ